MKIGTWDDHWLTVIWALVRGWEVGGDDRDWLSNALPGHAGPLLLLGTSGLCDRDTHSTHIDFPGSDALSLRG